MKSDSSKKPKILFVDDETIILNFLKRTLQPFNDTWHLDFVNGVEEALQKVENNRFDIILSDITMPGKTGFDLVELLQKDERNRHIPVILLSGLEESDLKRKALELGAIDLLPKPVPLDDLVARITSVLRLKEYQNKLLETNRLLKKQLLNRQRLELLGKLSIGAFHDLNNMLTIISGYSQMYTLEPEFAEKNIEQISDSCCQASEFTRKILNFAKSDLDRKELSHLGEIVDQAVILLRRCIPKQIEISWKRPAGMPQILVNQTQIIQLLMDLCLNVAHEKKDRGTITLSLTEIEIPDQKQKELLPKQSSLTGKCLNLTITDSQIEEVDTKLQGSFAPDSSPNSDPENPDLTWDIAETIVQKQDGMLRIKNAGQGETVINVYLPAAST